MRQVSRVLIKVLAHLVAGLLTLGALVDAQATGIAKRIPGIHIGNREIVRPPYLVMPGNQDPDPSKGRFLYLAERERVLRDFDTDERFPLAEGAEYSHQLATLRKDGWYAVPVQLQNGQNINLWSCDWVCNGVTADSGLSASLRATTSSQGRRIWLRRESVFFPFKGRLLQLVMHEPDKSWYLFETLRAEAEDGEILWERVYMVQTQGYNEGRYDYYGRKDPLSNFGLSVKVYPGLDWVFVAMSTGEGKRFNNFVVRIDLQTGDLVVPHPNIRAIPRREMEQLLSRALRPLELDKKFVASLAEDDVGEERLAWSASDEEAEIAYRRIFGAIQKKYFNKGSKR